MQNYKKNAFRTHLTFYDTILCSEMATLLATPFRTGRAWCFGAGDFRGAMAVGRGLQPQITLRLSGVNRI